MLTISYSGRSRPSAEAVGIAYTDNHNDVVALYRSSSEPVDVNWGRNRANAQLNPDISNVTNKKIMRQLFAEHDVPTPKLVRITYGNEPEFPLVGRPDQHTKGRGFWKVNNMYELQKAIRGTRKKRAATHFMEYIEADREYRVHIFKGKSIRISQKVYTDDSKKEYTTGKPGDIKLAKVRNAAKLAVEAVGLDFGAVDILARGHQNEEVFVLEVNSAPGVGGSMPKLYADTFKKWKEEQC